MNNVAMVVRCEEKAINKNISNEESIRLIREAGFDKVFMSFQNEHLSEGGYKKYLEMIRKNGLDVVFVHLGYRVDSGIATIWEEGDAGDKLVENYLKDLEMVAKDGIKMVCMHVTKSNIQSPMSEIGISRWRKIVEKAEQLGIIVALENTVWEGYLEFILDNIESPNLMVCFDSGHNHFHFKDRFNFDRFKDKIACLHLHDNDQSGDQHRLPFDGTIEWKEVVQKLRDANYRGVVTCESVYSGDYVDKISPKAFFEEAKERLSKIDKEIFMGRDVNCEASNSRRCTRIDTSNSKQ